MTKLSLSEIHLKDNVLAVWRHKHFSTIIFYRKYIDPFLKTEKDFKGDVTLRKFKIWRHTEAPHIFFQLTDEEVQRMILPRTI